MGGQSLKKGASTVLVSEEKKEKGDSDAEIFSAESYARRIVRTFRTRAYLSRAGHERFDAVLHQQCLLYNAALEERKSAWKGHRLTVSYSDQCRSLTAVRADFPNIEGSLDRRVQAGTLKRLDRAFRAFFRRLGDGEARGYPRFKSSQRWKTIEMYSGASKYVRYDPKRGKGFVRIKGLPTLRFKDRRVPGGVQPLEIRVTRRPTGIYLCLVFDHLRGESLAGETTNPVGINAGGSRVRWGLSDGTTIPRRETDPGQQHRLQRKIARQKNESNSRHKTVRQLGRLRYRERLKNRNELHRISTRLIRSYDHFVIEDLDIKAITRSASGTLDNPGQGVGRKAAANKVMLEQNWGAFSDMLAYKAEGAGKQLVRVDPAYTSLTCSHCGAVRLDATEREKRSVRFRCRACGIDLNRSINAARNILARGLQTAVPSADEPLVAGMAGMEDFNNGGTRCPPGKL